MLVDDAHWLDGSSAEALLFAVRRLVADPIAVVLASREGEPSLLDGTDLPALRMKGLDPGAAAELVQRESSGPVTHDVTDRLYRSTAGNPLALLELAADAPQLAGAPVGGPLPVATSIAHAFLRRSGSLPKRTRRLLVLAAASDGGELAVLEHAAASLGLDLAELAPPSTQALVEIENGTIEFRHPLARSAVYGDAPPQERRHAHRELADALPDRDLDQRAWHLASAAVGIDEAASAALEQAGERARARSAYTVSAGAFERAARLAPASPRQCGLLCAAADAAWLAGQADRTAALLDDAERHDPGVSVAARIDRLRAGIAMKRGPVMQTYTLLVAAAERVAEAEPALEELRAALELFDRLGASPWAELVSAELAATGETPAGATRARSTS